MTKRKHKSKSGLVVVLIVAVLLVAFFTNPSQPKHNQEVKDVMTLAVKNVIDNKFRTPEENTLTNALAIMAGGLLGDKIVDQIVDSRLVYHNYFVFSTSTITMNGEEEHASLGIFGKVFTASKEDMVDILEEFSDIDND